MKSRNGNFIGRIELERIGVRCGGDEIRIHESVVLIDAERLELSNHVRVDPFCILSAGGGIVLGSHIHIAAHCSLIGGGGIQIDDFAGISHGSKLLSASDDLSGNYLTGPTVADEFRNVLQAPIHVGRHVVIGAGAVVLPGATLGEGAVVGALSLVRHNLPAWTVWAGIPAQQVHERSRGLLGLEKLAKPLTGPTREPNQQ